MRFSVRSRTLVIAAASASLIAVPLALPASAAAAPPGACKKLATKTVGAKLTANLSSCTPAAATGGSGGGTFTTSGATTGTLNITIKWAAGKGTTKANIKFGPSKTLGKCPAGTTSRVTLAGKITGGTGTAFKTFKVGQPVTAAICVAAKSDTLEPGTALKF
jgi:hypothetical protein